MDLRPTPWRAWMTTLKLGHFPKAEWTWPIPAAELSPHAPKAVARTEYHT